MNALVPVRPLDLNGQEITAVSARELHAKLSPGRKFHSWIIGKVEEFGFEEGSDYVKTRSLIGPNLNRSETDYLLTLGTAKEVAMVERTDIGRKIRRYFIDVEEQFKKVQRASGWIEARAEGKQIRHAETDAIQAFVHYAEAQGSSSPKFYFVNITKLVNSAFLFLPKDKVKNLRDNLSAVQLTRIAVAEDVITRHLLARMSEGAFYKIIYQELKTKVEALAAVIGRSEVVLLGPKKRHLNLIA